MNEILGSTRKCPMCGKAFHFTCRDDEWGYAYDGRLTCSYHCMREMERIDRFSPPGRDEMLNGQVPCFLRRYLRGASFEELSHTSTARFMGLNDAEAVKRKIYGWCKRHPDEAKAIREEIEMERSGVSRQALSEKCAANPKTVQVYAARLGITGKRCGRNVFYTEDEAARIVASFRTVVTA